MVLNAEAESFFLTLSAHSDVSTEFRSALGKLGEYEVRYATVNSGALYAVTKNLVFCGAAGMDTTYWRLRPKDFATALATGATAAPFALGWVGIESFRSDWPDPDLPFWAMRAYDFARTGR